MIAKSQVALPGSAGTEKLAEPPETPSQVSLSAPLWSYRKTLGGADDALAAMAST